MGLPLRKKILILLAAAAAAVSCRAAAAEAAPVATAPVTAAPAPAPATAALRRLVIAETLEQGNALRAQTGDAFLVVAESLRFLNVADLEKRLIGGRGQPISEPLLVAINQIVEGVVRATENPLSAAIIPAQNIGDGTVVVTLLLGRYREIKFVGNRWYSDTLIRQRLGVEPGRAIRLSELDQAVARANASPFRRLRVHLDPIPNSTEANMVVTVEERLPLRLTALVDNAGNEYIGRNRIVAGVTYGNLWGREHQVTYQRITTDRGGVMNGDTFEYAAPLGRQQMLSLSGQRSRARPEFYGGLFAQDGRSSSLEARWHGPLTLGGRGFDASGGISYKASNNNLEYGGQQVLANTSAVIQAAFSLSTVIRDTRGAWAFSATGTVSPGNISDRNSDAVFNDIRAGAKSSYLIGQLTVQRLVRIGARGEMIARATLQRTTSNLLASEQLNAGGTGSVRGYRENSVSGDRGVLAGIEMNFPLLPEKGGRLVPRHLNDLRALAFYEAASVGPHRATGLDAPARPIASAGTGLRLRVAERFAAHLDYGWQLLRIARNDPHGRLHVRLSGAF